MNAAAKWAVDVSEWAVGSADWTRALALLPDPEVHQVTRFLFPKDQKLALASRLLQRALVRALFGVPWAAIDLARTPENKPFWRRPRALEAPPATWNFNVSHHGALVAIVCHAHALVGVDVVRTSDRPRGGTTVVEFFRAFHGHFTGVEWAYIRQCEDPDAQFARFYRLWSLKESFIKAVGIGLGFALQRAEFAPHEQAARGEGGREKRWRMRLDGRVADDWAFECVEIDGDHVVSIAHGPVRDVWRSGTSDEDASSIFPVPIAELTADHVGSANASDGRPSEWRTLSLGELIAYAQDEFPDDPGDTS